MRNLLEYPITYSEAIKVLDDIQIDIMNFGPTRCGDMRPVILQWTKEKLLELMTKEIFNGKK